MNVLLPMAGAGSRFVEQGYSTPKPLLPLMGHPMVVNAANALPKGKNYVFVVRDYQIKDYQIDRHLNKDFPNCKLSILDHLTEGQAVTCLHAQDLIAAEESLVIGASDNGMIYNREEFNQLCETADAIVFTFRNNPAVLEKPQAYGWVQVDSGQQVEHVSVKVPISETPLSDHAVVGSFWFKKATFFFEAAQKMILENRRVNNEFYVDECINDLIDLGYQVKNFEIEHYVCWGTPADYETFLYWERFYKNHFSSE